MVVAIPTPAPGADISFTPSMGEQFALLTLFAQLATSAAVANRVPNLKLLDRNNDLLCQIPMTPTALVASTTQPFSMAWGISSPQLNNGVNTAPLPENAWPDGLKLTTATTGIQAADQWSLGFVMVELLLPEVLRGRELVAVG